MAMQVTPSPNRALSGLDGIAAGVADLWILIGRALMGWLFIDSGAGKLGEIAGFADYLRSLNAPLPQVSAWIGAPVEFGIGLLLVLGLATRYVSAIGIIFLIVATALAHRYWEYPADQVEEQAINFLKNAALIGGMIYVFVHGPGRFSGDAMMSRR